MRIGFDASRAFAVERTGTENYSYEILKALVKLDHWNQYLVFTRNRVSSQVRQQFGAVKFKRIGWPSLWTQAGLALATWRRRLDVLFVPAHTLPVLRQPNLPTVVTIHGLEYEYLPEYYKFPQKLYLTWSTRYAVRFATSLLAVSKFTASDLVRRLGAERSKITVVHEGVDAKRFSKKYSDKLTRSVLIKYGITKPFVLFVGVVQPRKNLVRLVEAFSIAAGDGKTQLVIGGKLGWIYDEIIKAPRKLGIEERVNFIGFIKDEDLPLIMQEAEVYIQPSLTEGFGLPVLEAMAAGTPVVAAKSGALPEVVGKAGLLVNPRSVADMARALRIILEEKDLREGLIEKGFKKAREFSWEKAAKETLTVLIKAAKTR